MRAPVRVLAAAAAFAISSSAIPAGSAAPSAARRADAAPGAGGTYASIRLAVALDAARGRIAGRVRISYSNPTASPLTRAYLWLYPNRLSRAPEAIDDVNHYWIYPRRFDPGWMKLVSAGAAVRARAGDPSGPIRPVSEVAWRQEPHALAGRGALWSIELPAPVPPGGRADLELTYEARAPARYGSFGCMDGACTLLGGFYPMPAALDVRGWDLAAPPMRADIDAVVALSEPASAVLLGQVEVEPVWSVRASARGVAYAALVVAPRLHETQRVVEPDEPGEPAVTLRHVSRQPPPPADDARGKVLPYTKENYSRFALDAAAGALGMLGQVKANGRLPAQLVIVEVPLRFEIAAVHPGDPTMIALSDRYFRIWPAKRFRKFHERQLVRAVFGAVMADRIARARSEDDRDIDIAADFAASYLTDLYVLREYKKSEFLGDILDPVSFVPVVDQMLYAPQTMFAGAYFGSVLDDEPLRDDPRRFMHARPRGRLFYEKLRDLLAPEALRAAMAAVIVQGAGARGQADGARGFRAAAEAAYGAPLDWFFRQWNLPYPRVNYKLARIATRDVRDPDTATPGGREHEIVIERVAARGDTAPVEPVTVVVELDDGERERLRWDGHGERGVLRFRSDARIAGVAVDPGRRLVERVLPGTNAHPLFDNRDPSRTRFVFNSFGVLLNVTDLSGLLALDFTLARVHDVHNQLRLLAFTSEAVKVGATASYRRSYGPMVTPDTLLSRVSLTLRAQRLKGEFFAEEGAPARDESRVSMTVGVSESDKAFVFEPQHARARGVSGTLTVTRRDEIGGDAADAAEYLVAGVVSAGASVIATPRAGHTLALEGSAAAAVGKIEARSQLIGASGIDGLRGYAPGTLFGRASAMGRAEYRHVFVHDLSWNFGHYNFVRGFGGVLFFDAAWLTPCESYQPGGDGVYASAGYGLRFFYDSFGTLPQMMRLDVAVPLVQRSRSCLGDPPAGGPPVMVYLGFLPPF